MNSLIEEGKFRNLNTRTFLHDKNGLTNKEKEMVFKTLKYLANKEEINEANKNDKECEKIINEFHRLVLNSKNYDEIKNNIYNCETDECLLAHAIITYHIDIKSLLMLTIAIHSRVKPLKNGKDEWCDNFTLNSFLYQFTTFVYSDSDDNKKSTYSISKPQKLINKEKPIDNPKEILFHLGNLYRLFHEFNISDIEEIKGISNSQAVEMLDKLNLKYPYYTYQCHGCDCFTLSDKSVSIYDIKQFMERYPNSLIGGILNTKTYRSGKGQHWVALMFRNNVAYLFCSQSNNFKCFEEKTLVEQLIENAISMRFNPITIQHDPSNCGVYSTLFNLVSLINLDEINEKNNEQHIDDERNNKNNKNKIKGKGEDSQLDINKIVNEYIGENALKFHPDGIYGIKKMFIGY